jgi:hypothetical protein
LEIFISGKQSFYSFNTTRVAIAPDINHGILKIGIVNFIYKNHFMEKSKIGAQIYGYTVCLVAVITFLICTSTLVNSIFDLQDPIHSGWNPQGSPSLASYENYKMDILKSVPKDQDNSFIPDDQTLHAMFQAAKDDKIQSVRHQANRSMIISGLLIVICVILFLTHWQWLRKMSKTEP